MVFVLKGTANHLLWVEPHTGGRHVQVITQRTKADWTQFIRDMVDVDYPAAERIVLTVDNLSTHAAVVPHATFPAAEARRLRQRREVHDTPKHGTWLNIAEVKLKILRRQCLRRHIPDTATLTRETAAWETGRNAHTHTITWRYITLDPRITLHRLYVSSRMW